MQKDNYFHRAVRWVKKRGFTNIKANYEDYPSPTVFTKPNDDKPFIPDITAKRFDNKHYVEIGLKTDNVRRRVSKWKLLSSLAKMKGGKLYLLTPRGHKAFVQRIIDKYNLKAKVVYLPNV